MNINIIYVKDLQGNIMFTNLFILNRLMKFMMLYKGAELEAIPHLIKEKISNSS